MTSKNLFFKLMKENTKQRLWTVALVVVVFFFTFPVQAALNASYNLDPSRLSYSKDAAAALLEAQKLVGQSFMEWCSLQNGFLIFLMFLFSVVCGISGFAYLYSRKKTDFYHSLPVRRELFFAVQYVNGILYVAVAYLICMLAAAVILSVQGAIGISIAVILKDYLLHMAFYVLLYSTVILAVMMTGNIIVSLLGTAVFFGWGPCMVALVQGYCSMYYMTFYSSADRFENWYFSLSPAAWYLKAVIEESSVFIAAVGLLAAALITFVSVVLYRKRPSEAAGHAMAFAVSRPIIKLLLVVPSALLGSLLFQSILERDSWSVFGLICGLLLSSCVIEIIYHFDFRKLFAHKRQLAVCAVVSAAVLAFFRFDLSGYDSYLPSVERISSAGVYSYALDSEVMNRYQVEPKPIRNEDGTYRYMNWQYKEVGEVAECMHLEDCTPLLEIAREGVKAELENRKNRFSNGTVYEASQEANEVNDKYMENIVIAYHLQNGKTVYRSYRMDLHPLREQLDSLYNQNSYKTASYPVLSYKAEDIAGINYSELGEYSHVALSSEAQKAQLLETYQKEFAALTAEDRRHDNPVAALQFKTKELQALIDEAREMKRDYTVFNQYYYYPVFSSFTETIELLSECGIEVGEKLNPEKAEKIVLEYRGQTPANLAKNQGIILSRPEILPGTPAEQLWQDTETETQRRRSQPTLTVTDPQQIEEILDSAVFEEISNEFNELYQGIEISVYFPMEEESERFRISADEEITWAETVSSEAEKYMDSDAPYDVYFMSFDYDKVPEFVKAEFGLTEELMAYNVRKGY